jgi:oleandomycin transport system ATP-binding protein
MPVTLSGMYAIEAEGLIKRYGKTVAVDGVDLAVAEGTIVGLLGPNGAGKTTVVRMLSTLVDPDRGVARVGGFDVAAEPAKVRDVIALTGQYAAVDEDLTGWENLVLIGRLLELSRPDARRRAAATLERFGLTEAARRSVKTYSGGMRRRLDLGASLLGRPRVLFLDEPTTGLDPRSRGDVWQMIRDQVSNGVTVLLTTQYLDEADHLCDEIAVMDQGRVIESGTPAALKAKVGGQTLHVRPTDRADFGAAVKIVEALVGPAALDLDRGAVSAAVAPGSGAGVLATVAARFQTDGIDVDELGLRLASLDEVFLSLTGDGA